MRRPDNTLLSGLADALPLEPTLDLPRLPSPGALEGRIGRPGVRGGPLEEELRARASALAWRRVAYALGYLLVMAVAVGGFFARPVGPVDPSSGTVRLARLVQELPLGAPVLVAVDYGLGGSGELDPLLHSLLEHLSRRRATVVTVSTLPQGAGLAGLVAEAYPGATRSLGYLPGQPAGAGLAALSAEGPALLVVATDRPAALQAWVEQAGTRLQAPMVAVLSQGLGPQSRLYEQSGQIAASLAGLGAAAEYESLLGRRGVGLRGLDSYLALMALLLVTVAAGNLESLLRVLWRAGRRPGGGP